MVITSDTEVMPPLLDIAWVHLLPAFSGPGGDDARLADRLAHAALPVDGAGTCAGTTGSPSAASRRPRRGAAGR